MDERNDVDKNMDEIMLPGFRFHPTDEELVGFYLKRKIQHLPLSIELIKQLDIYKYDPWDLPKLAATGEKEWYFYCPRDRKYRNSARPNRVTGAGFWKATGTDRPIYSSHGNKCIGLKKSLVFYKGRAAKGIKTDWMMHEFRLPSLADSSPPASSAKTFIDKNIPPNDSWAICRIFKKTNSTAQRALSQSWVSPPILPEPPTSSTDTLFPKGTASHFTSSTTGFTSQSMSILTSQTTSPFHLNYTNELQQPPPPTNFSLPPLDHFIIPPYKPFHLPKPSHQLPIPGYGGLSIGNHHLLFSPLDHHQSSLSPTRCSTTSVVDASSMLLNMSSSVLGGDHFGNKSSSTTESNLDFGGGAHEHCNHNGFSLSSLLSQPMQQVSVGNEDENGIATSLRNPSNNATHLEDQWETDRSNIGFPYNNNNLPMSIGDAWKPNLLWDTSTCPSEVVSTSFSMTKCYT